MKFVLLSFAMIDPNQILINENVMNLFNGEFTKNPIKSSTSLDQAAELIPETIIVLNHSMFLTVINKSARERYFQGQAFVLGLHLSLVLEFENDVTLNNIMNIFRTDVTHYNYQTKVRSISNNQIYEVEIDMFCVVSLGEHKEVLVILRDISDASILKSELDQIKKELENIKTSLIPVDL
jgi:PAS domain-containing protein